MESPFLWEKDCLGESPSRGPGKLEKGGKFSAECSTGKNTQKTMILSILIFLGID